MQIYVCELEIADCGLEMDLAASGVAAATVGLSAGARQISISLNGAG